MEAIYLDYAATTPLRSEVRSAMEPFLDDAFGNPSSTHAWGRAAAAALADARESVAEALGADFSEILFTRGGTESDNLAVLGRTRALRAEGSHPTVAVSAVEHKAVLDAAAQAAREGATLRSLGVTPDGQVDLDALEAVLAAGHAVVSVMWVNNETGLVLPVPDVAERVRAAGGTFHTDAVQAVGKLPVRVDELPIDLLTVTGHKIYGPKGTGALFLRRGVRVAPLLHGGGQERELRPGTEDVAGAVGLATALRLAIEERETVGARLRALRERLEARLAREVDGLRVNAGAAPRAPHVASLGVPDLDGQSLVISLDLDGIAVSGGSACMSGATGASHVISALYGEGDRHATVRFSFGRGSDEAHVDRAVEVTAAAVRRLRAEASS